MKVLDLQCSLGHTFEGWFASEDDFMGQIEKALLQCPLCGDAQIVKKLSAPRLNLLAGRVTPDRDTAPQPAPTTAGATSTSASHNTEIAAAWLQMARSIVAHTDDVGTDFAEVARKMHYGETKERAIRGQTTPEEARSLVEEGIEVVPFALPEALKRPLQ